MGLRVRKAERERQEAKFSNVGGPVPRETRGLSGVSGVSGVSGGGKRGARKGSRPPALRASHAPTPCQFDDQRQENTLGEADSKIFEHTELPTTEGGDLRTDRSASTSSAEARHNLLIDATMQGLEDQVFSE